MNRLNITTAGLVAVCVILINGCREQTTTIGVIPRTTGTLLWEPLHLGVAEIAKAKGLRVYWNAPADEGDTQKQLGFITLSHTRRHRGLIFVPDETLASRSPILQAVKSGQPVVIVNDRLGPPPGPLLSYVANDEETGARLAADRIAKLLHGSGAIAIMGISPRLESGILREESFEKAIAAVAPGIHIEARRYGDSVVAHQQQIATDILKGARHVDAIVALSATATQGVYLARLAANSPATVKIVGFDQGILYPIQTGEVDSVVFQDTRKIGQIAMQNMAAELHGETASGITLVAPILVTRETLAAPEIRSLWEFARYPWGTQ